MLLTERSSSNPQRSLKISGRHLQRVTENMMSYMLMLFEGCVALPELDHLDDGVVRLDFRHLGHNI